MTCVETLVTVVTDQMLVADLTGPDDLRFDLLTSEDGSADHRLKVVTRKPMSLTRIMPHLAALGVEVIDERQSELDLAGDRILIYNLGFREAEGVDFGPQDINRFADALRASYFGQAEAGRMARLVMTAKLSWQQVAVLRAMSRYLQQAGTPFSQTYIGNALVAYPKIANALVDAFEIAQWLVEIQ